MTYNVDVEKSSVQYSYLSVPTVEDFTFDENALKFITAIQGPFGSGKSSGCLMKMIYISTKIINPMPDGVRRSKWAVVRNTFPQLRDTTLKTVMDWFPPALFGKFNKTDMEYKIDAFEGCEIDLIFRALDRPDNIDNLLSLELTGCWFNEYRQIVKEIFEAMQGRVGRYPSARDDVDYWNGIIMDTNPPDERSFWYQYFEKTRAANASLWKQPSGIGSNPENIPNLKKGYYSNLAEGKDDLFVKVYIQGEYGFTRDGKPVHHNYQDLVHTAKIELDPSPYSPLILAFDFGNTPACVFYQETTTGKVMILDAEYSFGKGISQFMQEQIKPRLNVKYPGYKIIVTGDPAGGTRSDVDLRTCYQEIGQQLPQADMIPCEVNDHSTRRNSLDRLLRDTVDGGSRLQICGRNHDNNGLMFLREALGVQYKYREIQNSEMAKMYQEKPMKNDHSHVAEACEYGAMFITNTHKRSKKVDRNFTNAQVSSWEAFV